MPLQRERAGGRRLSGGARGSGFEPPGAEQAETKKRKSRPGGGEGGASTSRRRASLPPQRRRRRPTAHAPPAARGARARRAGARRRAGAAARGGAGRWRGGGGGDGRAVGGQKIRGSTQRRRVSGTSSQGASTVWSRPAPVAVWARQGAGLVPRNGAGSARAMAGTRRLVQRKVPPRAATGASHATWCLFGAVSGVRRRGGMGEAHRVRMVALRGFAGYGRQQRTLCGTNGIRHCGIAPQTTTACHGRHGSRSSALR